MCASQSRRRSEFLFKNSVVSKMLLFGVRIGRRKIHFFLLFLSIVMNEAHKALYAACYRSSFFQDTSWIVPNKANYIRLITININAPKWSYIAQYKDLHSQFPKNVSSVRCFYFASSQHQFINSLKKKINCKRISG